MINLKRHDFSVGGIRNGTIFLIDYQTGSQFHPFSGVCFEGPLEGTRLRRISTVLEKWGTWVKLYPETRVVLSSSDVRERKHGALPEASFGASGIHLPLWNSIRIFDNRLSENELIFGIFSSTSEKAKAYPLEYLKKADGIVQENFDGLPIIIFLQEQYRVHAYVRLHEGKVLNITVKHKPTLMLEDQFGTVWNEWGVAVSGKSKGKSLEPVDGYLSEWYEWSNSFPKTEIAQ